MCFDVRRKIVRPIISRDEIKEGNGSGMNGSEKGIFAGITDRSRGKSSDEIGVIRCGSHQIFLGQIAVKIFYSIDHGGIALKGDLLF